MTHSESVSKVIWSEINLTDLKIMIDNDKITSEKAQSNSLGYLKNLELQ